MSERRPDGEIYPPYSRLFIVGSKDLTEKEYELAFTRFGDIEELWIVKDRASGQSKGVAFIKYAKTSQAAAALEEMNGKVIGNVGRSIKVLISANRDQNTEREDKKREEDRITRLFVKIPKEWSNDDLLENFKQFGNIEYVNVLKDRSTNENKGFGFVKFIKFSDAAKAYEECDRQFKAVFADPKKPNNNYSHGNENNISPPKQNKSTANIDGCTRLTVKCSPKLTQSDIWRLFDIVPELQQCQLKVHGSTRSIATVVYSQPKWASYAFQKLQGFEYPPGFPLTIHPDHEFLRDDATGSYNDKQINNTDLIRLAESLAQASSILQAAGLSSDFLTNKSNTNTFCNVKLPDQQPLEKRDINEVARCFIVCSPNPPPVSILRDVFCRFGHLIDVYLLNGKNCGYAKYSEKSSAAKAIEVLHGAEICGCRIKVIEADDPKNRSAKRLRTEEN